MKKQPHRDREQRRENPFAQHDMAARYERWYSGPGRRADLLEKRLLLKMLQPLGDVQSILDVGCGTGHFTRWFRELGIDATGLDSSLAMLEQARTLNGGIYVEGDALALPFVERSFDATSLITTLEFVADPVQALTEASRVARCRLLLGVLNAHSMLAWSYQRTEKKLWEAAHFYTVAELSQLVRKSIGERVQSMQWRTTLWPYPLNASLPLPWGGFIGLSVQLRP